MQPLSHPRYVVALAVLVAVLSLAGCAVPEESGNAPEKPAQSVSGAESDGDVQPEMTSGQKNALRAAENYLDLSGFSKAGLIAQLSSPAGDDYSKSDATFAANNVDVDWKEEAVEAAKNYLEITPMSKSALVDQLSSSAGDKFTPAQARYAANKVY